MEQILLNILLDLLSGVQDFISSLWAIVLIVGAPAVIGTILIYTIGRLTRISGLTVARCVQITGFVALAAVLLALISFMLAAVPEPWYLVLGDYFGFFAIPVLAIVSAVALKRGAAISLTKAFLIAVPTLLISGFLGIMTVFLFMPFT